MLRFTTAGESHGKALVSILEGMPAGLPLLADDVNVELARRQQGYGRGRRMQIEKDAVQFLSGVRAGETIGSPIAMLIENRDWKNWSEIMDPGKADDGRSAMGDGDEIGRIVRVTLDTRGPSPTADRPSSVLLIPNCQSCRPSNNDHFLFFP